MQIEKKISVIIPVYNWDIRLLVDKLACEIVNDDLSSVIEVLVADDCSELEYKENNKQHISKYTFFKYFELEKQLGRSKVRNFLVQKTKYPYILMLDADMLPDKDSFLAEYFSHITSDQRIVCGGYSYKTRICMGREYDFYVYKGKKTEEIQADIRNETPWRYLFTGNVLVPRKVLNTIELDEQFIGYGYEDTEWSIRLFKKYPIYHVDNTCSHLGLVRKDIAFNRMRGSIRNFLRIKALHPELFSQTGAARMARFLSVIPGFLLATLDRLLVAFFNLLQIDSICYYLFQLDKAVLLALKPDNERKTDDG